MISRIKNVTHSPVLFDFSWEKGLWLCKSDCYYAFGSSIELAANQVMITCEEEHR
jgi:hypothetical protein